MITETIKKRRSVRKFSNKKISDKVVKDCILNATLAPNSSNLQLWEFFHITDSNILDNLSKACLSQNAAKTAKQMVVIVTRKDLWRSRSKSNINFLFKQYKNGSISKKSHEKAKTYYNKIVPVLYSEFFGLLSLFRFLLVQLIGFFRPIYRQVTFIDKRIIAHKSAALAAQNFMLSMSYFGYDTCPMEGSDTLRVKKILKLSTESEINMIIACGIKSHDGVYSKRFRVPFEDVYNYI
tara:strand:- start:180 stop:890 length:711 start_codon:yes stop_codon:yes gene_type:complete